MRFRIVSIANRACGVTASTAPRIAMSRAGGRARCGSIRRIMDIIIAHLGNGASATAVCNGQSVDTTMGMTPLEGLVMGTRSGDIDFGAMTHIARTTDLSLDDIDVMLNKQSGLLGISELSSDCRTLEQAAKSLTCRRHPRARGVRASAGAPHRRARRPRFIASMRWFSPEASARIRRWCAPRPSRVFASLVSPSTAKPMSASLAGAPAGSVVAGDRLRSSFPPMKKA